MPRTSDAVSPSTSNDPVDTRPRSRGAQVVRLPKYGFSYEITKRWLTVSARQILKPSAPVVREMAHRYGVTPRQFIKTAGTHTQAWSISKHPVHGGRENVNVIGVAESKIDDQNVWLQLRGVGAKPGRFQHASSAAGDVTRVPYRLTTHTAGTVYGVTIVVDAGDPSAVITVTSYSRAAADKRADQIQGSLRKLG